MSAITTKFVTDHKLTNEMSIEELSRYAPEMHDLLGDDREKRRQARNRLQKGYKFSKGQAFALIPDQRIEQYISQISILEELGLETEVNISLVSENAPEGETIREMVQRIVQDNLSERNVKAISRTLVKLPPILSLPHHVSLGFEENCEPSMLQKK